MTAPVKGLSIICDDIGLILEVSNDTIFHSEQSLVGKLFSTLVLPEKRQQLFEFLLEIKNRTIAFGFEINFMVNNITSLLSPIGVLIDEKILIIASENKNDALEFLNEMQIINNEQSNTIRHLLKLQSGGTNKERSQIQLLNEITLLNNELVNLQRDLSRKNEELARFNEMKNRCLGIAAHDLRNPIGVIFSYTEFLIEETPETFTDSQRKFLNNIYESAKFAFSLIENLLDISKIESGKLELSIIEFDILELVKNIIELNNVFANRKKIKISFETIEKSVIINADSQKIQQVLNNLLTNAIKFSFPESIISVKMSIENNQVFFIVSDCGQGIATDKLDQIFLPFEKASISGTQGEKGAGLGLAIAKRIVEGHRGKIWVKSVLGMGTDFYFSLPLAIK